MVGAGIRTKGADMQDDICPNCGAVVVGTGQDIMCPECGYTLDDMQDLLEADDGLLILDDDEVNEDE